MIFYVKMDFTRKARFVAGGHMMEAPNSSLTYSSLVSQDSVKIAFLIVALNDTNLMSCYIISNAYLNAPCQENIWFVARVESAVASKVHHADSNIPVQPGGQCFPPLLWTALALNLHKLTWMYTSIRITIHQDSHTMSTYLYMTMIF
jgi:hypothetical protein